MPEIVFQYLRSTSRYRDVGDPEGDAWTFYDDGTVTHMYYVVGFSTPVRTVPLGCSPELMKELQTWIKEHEAEIAAINPNLDNGSVDGYYDLFVFGSHRITALNILDLDPETYDPAYTAKYRDNMIQEHRVITLFRGIYQIVQRFLPEVHIPIRSAGIV